MQPSNIYCKVLQELFGMAKGEPKADFDTQRLRVSGIQKLARYTEATNFEHRLRNAEEAVTDAKMIDKLRCEAR